MKLGDGVKVTVKSTVSRGYQTHIPKVIAQALELVLGDVLEWTIEGNELKVKKKKVSKGYDAKLGENGRDA